MNKSCKSKRRRAKERRGVRVLVWGAVLFVLAQLSVGLVLDYAWIRPRHPWWANRLAQFQARNRHPEIVFLGSSRFEGDVDCAVMDAELRRAFGDTAPRTLNAAVPAGDATVAERMLDDLFRLGYRPKVVVVEVDPGALAGRDNWLYQHAMNVLDWRDTAEAVPALVKNRRITYYVRGRLLPVYVHRYHLRKEAFKAMVSWFDRSEEPPLGDPPIPAACERDPDPPALTPKILAAMEDDYTIASREVKDFRLGGLVGRRMERLLERCRSEAICVVLVGPPLSSPRRRAHTPEIDAVFLGHMQQLCERYGCTYTDWRDKMPDPYFCDGHHAHLEGGVYFSRHFAASTLVPLWEREFSTRRN